jgi:hypothetical protein
LNHGILKSHKIMTNSLKYIYKIILVMLILSMHTAQAKELLDFTLHKLDSGLPGNTLLVMGGIQGDEPGGFNAASLLVTHYKIQKGSLWVVPNLNFISIIKRSRGIYGDMNRKFAKVSKHDPEFESVKKIKSIIMNRQVDMILNLHDGSGFYCPNYIDNMHNPDRWGQSIIIDQGRIESKSFGDLGGVADNVAANINKHLLHKKHAFHVMNTRTSSGNIEMSKTLTYFAIRNLKPALGIEASKSFLTHKRTYYHLLALEAFMKILGIEFKRTFILSTGEVQNAIDKNVKLAFFDNKIMLDVGNARRNLSYMPFKKDSQIEFVPSNPLLTVLGGGVGNSFRVYHGNRRLTHIHPEYFEYDSTIKAVTMQIDGNEKLVNFGEMVDVERSFMVISPQGFRVNVIGYKKTGVRNEADITIEKNDIIQNFSVDTTGKLYRVEIYREEKFAGMILINFGPSTRQTSSSGRLPSANSFAHSK